MRYFSYIVTFFAHPIWFPIYGAMLVLFQIPFSPSIEIVKYTWLLLLLITVALPTLVYLMLFVLNWLNDPFEVPLEKQKWLRCGYIAMLLLTAFKVTPMDHYPILYFYIMNLLISTFIILLMHYLKFVGNMFVMGVGALTVFSVLLSIFFEIVIHLSQWSHPFSTSLSLRATPLETRHQLAHRRHPPAFTYNIV